MFNKTQQNQIEKALELAGVEVTKINYFSNDRVEILIGDLDQQIISLAECGIFSPLKSTAITIWDTLGSIRSFDDGGDIEYFVIRTSDGPFAKFMIFPDMSRVAFNAREPEKAKKSNWAEDRQELLLEVAIKVEAAPVEELDEIIITVVQEKYIGSDPRRAALMFKRHVLDLTGGNERDIISINSLLNKTILITGDIDDIGCNINVGSGRNNWLYTSMGGNVVQQGRA